MHELVEIVSVTKNITEKSLKWDEGHVLRIMLDAPVPGKRYRKDRKSGGKTKLYGKFGIKREGRTVQNQNQNQNQKYLFGHFRPRRPLLRP